MQKQYIKQPALGLMKPDFSEEKLPMNDYSYALNIKVSDTSNSQIGVFTNVQGNELVSYTLPAGTNQVIGSMPYDKNKCIYYFVWNSNDFHSILEFDLLTLTITNIIENLTDSDGVDILKFDPSNRINHINIADGENFKPEVEITFSLTTGVGLAGTFATITNNGETLTDVSGLGGTLSTLTTLIMDTNYVTVSTDDLVATTMSVNGVSRTNGVLGAGTWVESFEITGGPKDILVIVSTGTPTSVPATGTWTFSNTSAANFFSGGAWNDGSGYVNFTDTLVPDDFSLDPAESGSVTGPTGILVSTIPSANSLVITASPFMSGFADLTIGAQPLQSFPLVNDGFGINTITGLSMNPSDNILITVRD